MANNNFELAYHLIDAIKKYGRNKKKVFNYMRKYRYSTKEITEYWDDIDWKQMNKYIKTH